MHAAARALQLLGLVVTGGSGSSGTGAAAAANVAPGELRAPRRVGAVDLLSAEC